MIVLCLAITIVVSYLLGGINSAIIVVKLKSGQDIRTIGSGNAGLTNTLRTQGRFAAVLVLAGDLLKGILAVLISRFVCSHFGHLDASYIGYVAGAVAIVGHVFPVYYGFKGGRGVLITASVLLVVNPICAVILISIFAVVVAITKYVSLGSIIAGTLYPVSVFIFCRISNDKYILINTLLGVFIAFMIDVMHRDNIKRLLKGTENKLGQKK